jgi:hypothetical protein
MPAEALAKAGVPGRIRTYDLRIRSPPLYPTELRARTIYGYTQDYQLPCAMPLGRCEGTTKSVLNSSAIFFSSALLLSGKSCDSFMLE